MEKELDEFFVCDECGILIYSGREIEMGLCLECQENKECGNESK